MSVFSDCGFSYICGQKALISDPALTDGSPKDRLLEDFHLRVGIVRKVEGGRLDNGGFFRRSELILAVVGQDAVAHFCGEDRRKSVDLLNLIIYHFTADDDKIYKREILRLRSSLEYACNSPEDAKADLPDVIGFLHYPPVAKPGMFSGFMQAFEDFGVKEVYYGHIHGEEGFRSAVQGDYYGISYRLISADYLNCCPIKIR